MTDIVRYMRQLTGDAFPAAIPVAFAPDKFRRKWAVRVRRSIPADVEFHVVISDIVLKFRQSVREEYGSLCDERGGIEEWLSLRFIRVDDLYLVVEIDLPNPDASIGDEVMFGTFLTLKEVDSIWGVEDLEGIPRDYWLIFRL